MKAVLETIAEEAASNADGPHLITVDKLRAAGSLDVPAAWRKSLGAPPVAERGLFDFDDTSDAQKQAAPPDEGGDEDGDTES